VTGCNNLSIASQIWRWRYLPGNLGTYFFCTNQSQCTSGTLADCLASGRNCYFGDESSCNAAASEDCGNNPPAKSYHWCSDQAACTQGFLSECAQSGKNCYLWETDPQGAGNGCLERANLECDPSAARYFWCDDADTCRLGRLDECNSSQHYCYRQEPNQQFCPVAGRLTCGLQTNIAVIAGDSLDNEGLTLFDAIVAKTSPFISLLLLLPLGILFILFPRAMGIVFDASNRQPLARALVSVLEEGRCIATSPTNRFGLYYGVKLKRGQYRLWAALKNYDFPSQMPRPSFYTLKSFYLGELFNLRSQQAQVVVHEIPLDSTPTTNEAVVQPKKAWWRWWRWLILIINKLQLIWGVAFIIALVLTIVYPAWFNYVVLGIYLIGLVRRLTAGQHQPNVNGRVVNAQGQAASDVLITLKFESGQQTALETLTDQNGEFKFFVDEKQSYNLNAPSFNFIETTGEQERLQLTFNGKILDLALVIKPKNS
jgi:hypothetical protein